MLKKHALLVATILVAIVLIPAGGAKLAGIPAMHASFATLGLPSWFGYCIGVFEIAGAVGIFIRPLRALAATGISIIMVGALYYHVMHTPLQQGIAALVVLVLCLFILAKSIGGISHRAEA